MGFFFLSVTFICLAISVQAQQCLSPITDDHFKLLDDMIEAQVNTSCSVEVKVIDENQLEGYCYKRTIISQLYFLLEGLKFKTNSLYFNYTKKLLKLYNERFADCIDKDDDILEGDLTRCSHSIYLSPAEMLDRIKTSFEIFRDFKYDRYHDCYDEFKKCKEDHYHLTEELHQDGRQKIHLLLVMIPSILAILFLCGLLYVMHYYRLLRQQLIREEATELHELRPFAE